MSSSASRRCSAVALSDEAEGDRFAPPFDWVANLADRRLIGCSQLHVGDNLNGIIRRQLTPGLSRLAGQFLDNILKLWGVSFELIPIL